MILINRLFLLLFAFSLFVLPSEAQEQRFTISGRVTDASSGEDLIGAGVMVKDTRLGTVTNAYGHYALPLPTGEYTLVFSYLGYETKEVEVSLTQDEHLLMRLSPGVNQLSEVVVSAEGQNAHVSKIEMSTERLTIKEIKRIPALMGEVDVIKAIQLLPGVQAAAEGTSGFSVRGGGHDQNLILLDEATVYNASHLMGFFSVFNNDAIKDVTLYKGDIPASFGGRLSSLLDIRSKEGNNQRFVGTGGIGLISSRLTLEGPVVNENASFLVSGRRTYADLFLKLSNNEDLRKSSLYFYDMNAKLNYRIDDNNRIFLSGYLGKDHFGNEFAGMDFANKTLTARWNHLFSPRLFSNFSLLASVYDYAMLMDIDTQINQEWKSQMQDWGLKADFAYQLHTNHQLKFGYNLLYHNFMPGEGGGITEESIIARFGMPREYALEHGLYLSAESTIADRLKLKYGLRYSLFQNIANGEELDWLTDYKVAYSKTYDRGTFYHNQGHLEPRLGVAYLFNDEHSVKASYSRTVQYIQLASNSTAGSPLDIWFQTSHNIRPQICDQWALGYFRNFMGNQYEASAELYYKNLRQVIDFKDHAQLIANENLEQEVRFGRGYAAGLELMVRKNEGPLTGWVSYTLSKSRRQISDINDGLWYRSPYDKPHTVSVVASYELSPKWNISANWVYASGTPVTYPTGRFQIEGTYIPIYSGRNEYRYPDYHRMDLSATWQLSKPGARLRHELNISLYNAYGRKNAWAIRFRQDAERPDMTYAEMIYLFSVVPSITWNFTF